MMKPLPLEQEMMDKYGVTIRVIRRIGFERLNMMHDNARAIILKPLPRTGAPIPELLSVGDAIYRIRTKKELSQDDLAIRSGVHRNIISRVENGSTPTLTNLSEIARGLEVDIWELMKFAKRIAPRTVQEVVNL